MPSPSRWQLYEYQPAFVIGFHGCDKAIGEAILNGEEFHLEPSANEYDWLGHGIYFWEGNPERALEFATQRANGGRNSKGKIDNPFVIGAIIDLKHCLDLLDSSGLQQVADAYALLKETIEAAGAPMPENKSELTRRFLDCAVINSLHQYRQDENIEPYDSVRAAFWEGEDLYPSAGFKRQNHIQICVRNHDCIKGYFRPIHS